MVVISSSTPNVFGAAPAPTHNDTKSAGPIDKLVIPEGMVALSPLRSACLPRVYYVARHTELDFPVDDCVWTSRHTPCRSVLHALSLRARDYVHAAPALGRGARGCIARSCLNVTVVGVAKAECANAVLTFLHCQLESAHTG